MGNRPSKYKLKLGSVPAILWTSKNESANSRQGLLGGRLLSWASPGQLADESITSKSADPVTDPRARFRVVVGLP
jgi:hypothetical protein